MYFNLVSVTVIGLFFCSEDSRMYSSVAWHIFSTLELVAFQYIVV